MNNRKHLVGWAGIVVTTTLTVGAMTLASATGLAKTPSAATLAESEDAGGAAVADSAPPPAAGSPPTTVDVTLKEWSITTSVATAKAGAVTFNIQNAGPANSHEFIILKTDIAPDALPTLRDKSLNESGAGITSPGEGGILPVGKKQTITVNMTPGKYVFVDNIVERGLVHWDKRAYATFTVTPASPGGASASAGSPVPASAGGSSKLTVTGGQIGGTAGATMHTAPGASCAITYIHPSGKTSTLKALVPKTAGPDGVVSWVWSISASTKPPGQGTVTVICGSDKATVPITIS